MGWLDSQCNFRYFPKIWPGVTLPGSTVPYRPGNCPVQPAEFNQQNYFQKCCFVGVGMCACGYTLQQNNNRTIEKWNKFFFEKNISFGKKCLKKKIFFKNFTR